MKFELCAFSGYSRLNILVKHLPVNNLFKATYARKNLVNPPVLLLQGGTHGLRSSQNAIKALLKSLLEKRDLGRLKNHLMFEKAIE